MGARSSLETFNSTVRTLVAVVAVGMLSTVAWFGYRNYSAPQRELAAKQAELGKVREQLTKQTTLVGNLQKSNAELKDEVALKTLEIQRLDTSLRLMKVDHRLAEVRVLDQQEDPQTGKKISKIQFVELNDEGVPIDEPREFDIEGDLVYIELRVVKFEDAYIEQSDLDRATSICLFQRIFGEFQEPSEGFPLDQVGTRPTAYARGGKMSEFEANIWGDFWSIANDRDKAAALGIRTIHNEAPSMKVQAGKKYRVLLRSSGGVSLETIPAQSDAAS